MDTKRDPASLIISSLPRGVLAGKNVGQAINDELRWRLEMLSGLVVGDTLTTKQEEILDNEIIRQTESLDALVLESSIVRARIFSWKADYKSGVEKRKRFGDALTKAARIFQHLTPAPLDPSMKAEKAAFVAELEVVLRYIQQAQEASRSRLSLDEIQKLFRESLANLADPEQSLLWQNLESWQAFIAAKLDDFRANLDKPAPLFDLWLAFWTGLREDTVRQNISRLKPSR
jgi:hypothetical protein